MNESLIRKLTELVDDGNEISDRVFLERWAKRAEQFIKTTVGEDEAASFHSLNGGSEFATHAMHIGRLEGLISKAEAETETKAAHSHTEHRQPALLSETQPRQDGRRVFVVHGHDEAAKESVARFLEKVGLQPIILHEQANPAVAGSPVLSFMARRAETPLPGRCAREIQALRNSARC